MITRPVRVRIWPLWHPLITGAPRPIPLTTATREQLWMEFDFVARRAVLARQHNGRLP